jgi:phosphoenolpyruvate carboxykinase (ATP)
MAIRYLNTKRTIFIVDGYAGWDPEYRMKIRCVVGRPYHAIFMRNMLVRPTKEELEKDFKYDENIDWHIFNAGDMRCPGKIEGITCDTTV